jgi:hypothetical protein
MTFTQAPTGNEQSTRAVLNVRFMTMTVDCTTKEHTTYCGTQEEAHLKSTGGIMCGLILCRPHYISVCDTALQPRAGPSTEEDDLQW